MWQTIRQYFHIETVKKSSFYQNDQISKEALGTETADLIVGVSNSFHDGAYAILYKEQIFAEGLERPTQLKRAMLVASPYYAIRSLLRTFLKDLQQPRRIIRILFRFSWGPSLGARLVGDLYIRLLRWRARFPLRSLPTPIPKPIVYGTRVPQIWFWDSYLFPTHIFRQDIFPKQRVEIRNRTTPHHLTHAANAVYTSDFDECAVMVLDGQGEWNSLSCYHFHNNRFEPIGFSHASLGLLYADVTAFCGFSPAEGEEWKVMGLAAYGALNERILNFFMSNTKVDGLRLELNFKPRDFAYLAQICGGFRTPEEDPRRAANLARSFQEYFTQMVLQLSQALQRAVGSPRLAYAGGCALNSATNGRLVSATGFQHLHVPSAPADDGNALGAALWERHIIRGQPYKPQVMSPYLGSDVDHQELEHILSISNIRHRRYTDAQELWQTLAELLDHGHIVGVMQGRAEFGPRALGHRSLLADPRRATMKDDINRLIKFREDYRPLAPAILHEYGEAYFQPYQFSPYMERALPWRPEVYSKIPAVVHVDGTGRLQSVNKNLNPRLHALISAFHQRTGIPLVVNTSLNVMGKPMVHSVKDAVQLLYTTGLKYMLIDRCLLMK